MVYYLKKYTPVKSNYEIHNKELLAIMRCLEAWDAELRSVLKGFDIIIDHKNIKYFIKKIMFKWIVNIMVLGVNQV